MQHIKIDIAKCVFVSSVPTGGYGELQRETSEGARGLVCHRKMSVEQCLGMFCGSKISLVPPMPSKGTGFPTRKSHESRTGFRGCLCETQTPLPQCTEPSTGFVMVQPGGCALRGCYISSDSDHPTHTCGGSWLFSVPLGAVTVPRAHTVHNPVIPAGTWRCQLWLQCGTERLCGQCCVCVCTAAWQ